MTQWWDTLRSPNLALGLVLVSVVLFVAVFTPVITRYNPILTNYPEALQPPSWIHPLGTDEHGRDVWARVVYGSRVTVLAAMVAVCISTVMGVFLGATAGFFGGIYDQLVSRLMDAFFGFPVILLAILVVTFLQPSVTAAMIAIGLSRVPMFVRVSRAAILAEKQKDYVEASHALDSHWTFILFCGILLNTAGPILVLISLGFAQAVLAEAALSFLGLGAQPPQPSWGLMLSVGRQYLARAPWLSLAPGAAIFLLVLGLNLIGDGLQEFADPRRRA